MKPSPADVRAYRERVQDRLGLGITQAQDWCAKTVGTSRRGWQHWEFGDRAMPQAAWELAKIKEPLPPQNIPRPLLGQQTQGY